MNHDSSDLAAAVVERKAAIEIKSESQEEPQIEMIELEGTQDLEPQTEFNCSDNFQGQIAEETER